MKNLNNKIFIVLVSLLSFSLLIIIVIYNGRVYEKEKEEVEEIINRSIRFENNFNIKKTPIIVEKEFFVITFNSLGEVEEVINYSYSKISNEEIIKLVEKYKDKINIDKISSLYFNNYILNLNKDNQLVVINNQSTKSYLYSVLFESIILFILVELIIIYLSYTLTKWITKPVEEAFKKQKQFIYDASHELKTPLAIISASAETLENDPKETKWLDNIKSETVRMNELVKNLLELSKSENIKENEVFEEENLSKIVKKSSLSFESIMFEKNLTLETNINEDIKFICNSSRIKELLSILLDNAIKHGEKDSTITVNLYKEKNNIILEVINKGKEIPIEEQEKIFERFYRIDKSRNRNENRYGLGLSIAKNIVINHNGNISVKCYDGYTKFIVRFKKQK